MNLLKDNIKPKTNIKNPIHIKFINGFCIASIITQFFCVVWKDILKSSLSGKISDKYTFMPRSSTILGISPILSLSIT